MSDARPRAVLLGASSIAELPAVSLTSLPHDAHLIAVDCATCDPRTAIADVRAQLDRRVTVVGLLGPAATCTADELLAMGYDDVAVTPHHLRHLVEAFCQRAEQRLTCERQSAIHDGLLQLITEIARNPGLQQVLKTAVLRMSELFSVERVSVVIFDQSGEVGFVVMEREQAALENIVINVGEYPELRQVIQSKRHLIITDVFGDALLEGVRGRLTNAHSPPVAAVLFPLLRKDQVVGALFLRSKDRMAQVDDDLLVMGRLIASVTSVAIGHALEHDMLLSEKRALQRSKAWADEQLAGLKELREFLDQAKDGILITDHDGVIRYANEAAGAILRQPLQLLAGRRFCDLLLGPCLALAERALRGEALGFEDGYLDLTLAPIGGQGGAGGVISAAIRPLLNPEGVFISFRDVTALREIESELRHTKEFLENLIHSSVDAIIATDIDGRVILFNRAAEQMLGYLSRDVVGSANVSIFYPAGEAAEIMRRLRSESHGGRGKLQLLGTELVAKDGTRVPANLTAAIIYEDGRETASVSILSDLRERRRIEEKLSQVQRKLQMTERQSVAIELAGVAAHELNQPLTSILGYGEMLKRRIGEADPGRKAVEVICRETERMAGIVRRLGQITNYQTKPYVGSSQILDLSDGSSAEPGTGGGRGEPDPQAGQ